MSVSSDLELRPAVLALLAEIQRRRSIGGVAVITRSPARVLAVRDRLIAGHQMKVGHGKHYILTAAGHGMLLRAQALEKEGAKP